MAKLIIVSLLIFCVYGCGWGGYENITRVHEAEVVKVASTTNDWNHGLRCTAVVKLVYSGEVKTLQTPVDSCVALIELGQRVQVVHTLNQWPDGDMISEQWIIGRSEISDRQ